MPWRRVGFITLTVAIVLLVMTVYGVPRALGPRAGLVIAAVALTALVIGVAILLVSLRSAKFGPPHAAVVAITAIALLLHLYEAAGKSSDGFSIGFLLWAMVPYILCLAISSVWGIRRAAIGGALVAVIFDFWGHYAVFVNPKGSTAGLALLFIPLWNTLILVPAATAIAYVILRRRSTTTPGGDHDRQPS